MSEIVMEWNGRDSEYQISFAVLETQMEFINQMFTIKIK